MQNYTVFVISMPFLNEGVQYERYFIFMKGVPASNRVGNLCPRPGVPSLGYMYY